MNNKTTQLMIAVIAVIGFSTATALVVHHNDNINKQHAMMMSDSIHSDDLKKATADAAMKQAEADKAAAAHDAIMKDSTTTTSVTQKAQ